MRLFRSDAIAIGKVTRNSECLRRGHRAVKRNEVQKVGRQNCRCSRKGGVKAHFVTEFSELLHKLFQKRDSRIHVAMVRDPSLQRFFHSKDVAANELRELRAGIKVI